MRKRVSRQKKHGAAKPAAGIPDYLQGFVEKKLAQINASSFPQALKGYLSAMLCRMAGNYRTARLLAQPKISLPHSLLVELHANTMFKEFQRFLQSRNIADFISKRHPLREMEESAKEWYGTRQEMKKEVEEMLEKSRRISDERKKEVRDFLAKNKNLSIVQLHRARHYVVGLEIEAKLGFKRKAK